MIDLLALGPLISGRRKDLRLTQLELAQKARISRATLDALENQRLGELGYNKLSRLLQAVGLELKVGAPGLQRPTLDDLREENSHDESLDRRG